MSTSAVSATRLILVAHAATAATRRTAFATPEDLPGAADLAAARRLALPEAVVALAGPARAATVTADALRLTYGIEPALRDLDAGRWSGMGIGDIEPDPLAAWIADPDFTGHGGESLIQVVDRVRLFLRARLTARGTTVAVTHAAVVRAATVAVLDAPAGAFWRIEVPPLSRMTLGSDGRRWSLRGLEAPPPVKASGG